MQVSPTLVVRFPQEWKPVDFYDRVMQVQVFRPWVLPSASSLSDGPVANSFKIPSSRAVVPALLNVSWLQGAYPLANHSSPPDARLSHGWIQIRGRGLVRARNTSPLNEPDCQILHRTIRETGERISAGLRATAEGAATVFWASKDLLRACWKDPPPRGEHPILVVARGKQLAWTPGRSKQPHGPALRLFPSAVAPWAGEGSTWFDAGRLYPITRTALRPELLDVSWKVNDPQALARELAAWKVLQ